MKAATAEKSSTTSATVTQAAKGAFVARAGDSRFFRPAARSAPLAVQAKMTVSKPGDKFEQEADSTASKVMRMEAPSTSPEKPQRPPDEKLQKREDEKVARAPEPAEKLQRKDDDKLQRDAMPGGGTPAVDAGVQSAIQGKTTGGEPLSAADRGYMEPRFQADFANVRIHRDGQAASLNNQLSARAFTYQNHIFFSRDQYQPGSSEGRHLLAHELTHTIQQGHSIQRSPQVSTTAATPTVQRLGVQDVLDKFAEWAYAIPGFRLLTLILGFNPINMRSADRTAANILRAMIEVMPGGNFITRALDNHGVINKAATWIEQKLAELGDIGGDIIAALKAFLNSLGWTDIFHPRDVWDRAKRIFTEPIDRLIRFAASTVVELLKIVKDAILKPLAAMAQGTRGYDLLCAILGEDPVTGQPVPRNAETLLGGFMKLIGQEEIWENIKKGNAIARAYAWFQTTLEGLMGMVRVIPQKIVATIMSLTFEDVVTVVGAFRKVVGAFVNIAVDFISWGLTTIWNLLEIVFDVVKPGLMGYIRKTGAALKSILKNPLPFLGNLLNAGKLGFSNFATNFTTHLKAGLIDWLTGSLQGVYIPKALSLVELGRFALSVLGITWAQIRGKIVKALGERGEQIMLGLELAFDVVKALVVGGATAAWELIKDKLADLRDQVVNGIISFVSDTIIKKAIPKLISLFIPGAGFIGAIVSIYDTVLVFVQKIAKIIEVVTAFIESIVTIAAGNITATAHRVERILAGLLSLAISFLAGFLGLGKVTDKIMGVIEKVRASVDKAIDAVINWIVDKAKALFGSLVAGAKSIFNWWKKKLTFGSGSEKHELYFEGDEDSAELMVASNPRRLENFVSDAGANPEYSGNPKKMAALGRLAAEIPKLKEVRGNLRSLKNASDDKRKPYLDALDKSFANIGEELQTLFMDSKGGTAAAPILIDWPKPEYHKYLPLNLFNQGSVAKPKWKLSAKKMDGVLVAKYHPSGSHELSLGSPAPPSKLKDLGIRPAYQLIAGSKIGPVAESSTPGGDELNSRLKDYGWDASAEYMDGDHVVEIQFGGKDELGNLWPLDASINRGAGSKLSRAQVDLDGQKITVDWLKKVKKKPEEKAIRFFFKVRL